MKNELLFKNLFARALKDWPEEIIFGILIRYDSPGYSVEGLYNFAEEIENIYINQNDEVIMANLHWRIFGVLHGLAEFALKVRMQDLRPERVQKIFEDDIRNILEESSRSNWTAEDVQLVQDYFAVNYPPTDIAPEKIT